MELHHQKILETGSPVEPDVEPSVIVIGEVYLHAETKIQNDQIIDNTFKEGAETFIGLNLTTNTIRRTGRRI